MLRLEILIISNIACAVGENYIAAFLTDRGSPEDIGKISGFEWVLDYVTGLPH